MFKASTPLAAILLAPTAAIALDCGAGTTRASFQRFHSEEFAGRLAIAARARNSDEAKGGRVFCVLQDGTTAHLTGRSERIYFVFNNLVTSSPDAAETAFLGLEVRSSTPTPGVWVSMRREGESWIRRDVDERFRRRQLAFDGGQARFVAQAHQGTLLASLQPVLPPMRADSSDTMAALDETKFAATVDASVHGAVRPRPGVNIKTTWDLRHKLGFVSGLYGADDLSGQSVSAVWSSFDQRVTPPSYRRDWARRVVTEVRVGTAEKVEVHLFGSNGAIPEQRINIVFD